MAKLKTTTNKQLTTIANIQYILFSGPNQSALSIILCRRTKVVRPPKLDWPNSNWKSNRFYIIKFKKKMCRTWKTSIPNKRFVEYGPDLGSIFLLCCVSGPVIPLSMHKHIEVRCTRSMSNAICLKYLVLDNNICNKSRHTYANENKWNSM